MIAEDVINIGLSEEGHTILQQLREGGVFNEMTDGYRFAIGLAIALGKVAPETTKFRTNWNIGSIDPDASLRNVITELFPEAADHPYTFAERLAEAGVIELGELNKSGHLRFSDIFVTASKLSEEPA